MIPGAQAVLRSLDREPVNPDMQPPKAGVLGSRDLGSRFLGFRSSGFRVLGVLGFRVARFRV